MYDFLDKLETIIIGTLLAIFLTPVVLIAIILLFPLFIIKALIELISGEHYE